jgi:hypothetical protein
VEPVPGWTRVIGVLVAVGTGLIAVPAIALTAAGLLSTVAQVQRTTAFDVGPAPRLQVDVQYGTVAIEAARDGRIAVEDQRSAGSITRASAAAAVDQMAVDVSRQGDLVRVRQALPVLAAPGLDRNSVITIRVPAATALDVSELGDLRIQGIDAAVRVSGTGTVELRDSTLRGTSTIDVPVGTVQLTNVTVAGSAAVKATLAGIAFDGRLAPGGSALDIQDGAGGVSVVLPRPTDARATITTSAGQFRADGTWLFTPDQVAAPRRWTADLAPDPTGTVTVRTTLGGVDFGSR